jgi:beta-carotene ketolase (CrtW type)
MAAYLTPAQMLSLLGGWLVALMLLAPFTTDPLPRLLLFWTLPLLLSSLQLFLFGTYLPHRRAPGRSSDRHRAVSLVWPELLSFLACYHFGYHWEHHCHPHLPWFRLPAARRLMTVASGGPTRLALPQASR